ncbi:FRAS1-related extracellular matrix protein 2-like [Dysidea avara]|uniref:FRAS1-related extracellular matrix protein 2-like n=1 Tax=Dysidea avara TaxID=196820 RepID=UPI003317AD79
MLNKYIVFTCLLICCWLAESSASYSNDDAVYVSFESSHYHVNESDGSLEIGLVASPKPSFTFTIALKVIFNSHKNNGSFASEEDVDTSTVTIKFRRSKQKAAGTIKIFSDDVVEGVELFAVKMILPSHEIRKGWLKYGRPRHILVYIRDTTSPPPLMVQLSTSDYVVMESSNEVCLKVETNSTTTEPFSVFIMPMIKEPTSATGGDFNSSVSEVKFSERQSSASVCIPIYDDSLKEGNETFGVLLSVPDDTTMIPGQHVMASVTIIDDASDSRSVATLTTRPVTKEPIADKIKRCGCKPFPKSTTPLVVQLSTGDYVVEESSGEVCLEVVANSTTSEPFSVYVMPIAKYPISATSDDFSSLVSVAKFSVGQSNTSVCIPIRDDCLKEGNETFSVLLNVPNNTALIPGQLVMATITILDDANDTKSYYKSCPATKESIADKIKRCGCKPLPKPTPTPSPTQATMTSTLFDMPSTSVTVTPSPAVTTVIPDATSVTPLPTTSPAVCIGFGRVSTTVNESDEFVTINLIKDGSNAENITVFITVMMQDQPGPSSPSPAIIVTSLMIDIPALVDGIIPIRIELLDDSTVEQLEFYELVLELGDTDGTSVKLGEINTTYIIVADDDKSETMITVAFNSSTYSGTEADGIIPVTVVATGTASIPYTVIITPLESDPRSATAIVDFSSNIIDVTFNPGETEKTVNVVINPDCLREGSEFFNLSLSLSSAALILGVGLGDPSEAVAEIEDIDEIHVNFSQVLYSAEEADGMLTVTLEADGFSIWPFTADVTPMEVGGSAGAIGGGVDFASDPLTAVFTPGASQATVSMAITRDDIFEQTEMLKFTLTVPDKFSDINGMLFIKIDDIDMADGEIINSVGI